MDMAKFLPATDSREPVVVVTNGSPSDLYTIILILRLNLYDLRVLQVTARPHASYAPAWRAQLANELKSLCVPFRQVNAADELPVDFLVNRLLWLSPVEDGALSEWSRRAVQWLHTCSGHPTTICCVTDAASAVALQNHCVNLSSIMMLLVTRLPEEPNTPAFVPCVSYYPLYRYTIMSRAHSQYYKGTTAERDVFCKYLSEATDAQVEQRLMSGYFTCPNNFDLIRFGACWFVQQLCNGGDVQVQLIAPLTFGVVVQPSEEHAELGKAGKNVVFREEGVDSL